MIQFIQDNVSKPEFWEFLLATAPAIWAINSLSTALVQRSATTKKWIRVLHGLLNQIDPEGNAK